MRQMLCGNWPRGIDKHNGTWQSARDITGVDAAEVMMHMRRSDLWWNYYDADYTVWTCDLTYDYVKINADYHT